MRNSLDLLLCKHILAHFSHEVVQVSTNTKITHSRALSRDGEGFVIEVCLREKMIYSSKTDNGSFFTFSDGGENKLLIPKSTIILIDDESGFVSIKQIGCRKTLGLYRQ